MEEESPKITECSKSKPKAATIPLGLREESKPAARLWRAQDQHGNTLKCDWQHDGPHDFGPGTRYITDLWSSYRISVHADFYFKIHGIRHSHELEVQVARAGTWQLFIETLNKKQEEGAPKFILEGAVPPDIKIRMSNEQ